VRSPFASILAGLLILLGLLVVLRPGATGDRPAEALDSVAAECEIDPFGCAAPTSAEGFPGTTGPTVPAAEVCPRSAYLCHGFRERGVRRVMRWPDDATEIEIRIPRPTHVDRAAARELQAAAARGILAWQNAPLPLRITRSDRAGSEDFAVSWSQSVLGNQLGRTGTQWERRDGVPTMRVTEMVLATHGPGPNPRPLDPGTIALTAAHEMGHALGLPHSDEERDLMYPTNTAPRMSTRDYRAMEALYALENGVEVVDEAR
jgi:hypothetical protein